jgi:hypothetical protein
LRERAVKASQQHQGGLLDKFADFREELGGDRAIDDTVVA